MNKTAQYIRSAFSKAGSSAVSENLADLMEQAPKIKLCELENASEYMANIGRAQVVNFQKILNPDAGYIKQLTDKYSKTDSQISMDMLNVKKYLQNISSNLENISASGSEYEEALSKKAVIDYLIEHISYEKFGESLSECAGFRFGLPSKKIFSNLAGFQEEFDKSVSCFKKEGIFSVSDYNLKKHQFDAESIMKKYAALHHEAAQRKYNELFDPIYQLKSDLFSRDPYLNSDAAFYRIISPGELKSLVQTKKTKAFIDSNGYFTNGHYSCITANPNYNEQAFAANGLPIRIKFKTKDSEGLYNMDLFNRIGVLKPERSIYRVWGYNFDDIDWNNVCINRGQGWERLSRNTVEDIISSLQN